MSEALVAELFAEGAEEEGAKADKPLTYQDRMLKKIKGVDERAWSLQEKLLTSGYWQLDKAWGGGVRPGVYIIPGQTNMGKTAFMTNLALEIAQKNENALSIYVALDENDDKVIPRLVATLEGIPIWLAEMPHKYMTVPGALARRNQGFRKLEALAERFVFLDVGDGDGSVEWIINEARACLVDAPSRQLCIFIDFFHDLTTQNPIDDKQERYSYILHQLMHFARTARVPIFTTAELRKVPPRRRPQMDDVRETVRIIYKADCVMMFYSEVAARDQEASLYWTVPGKEDRLPVLDCFIAKTRFGSKQTVFFKFLPEQSKIIEPTLKEVAAYREILMGGF